MRSLLALALLASACTTSIESAPDPPRQHLPRSDDPTFTLYVSNQSFDLSPVDIQVGIDGQTAVTGDFVVEGQHTWIPFDFELAPGPHQLRVASWAGGAMLDQAFDFDMDARRWGVLSFWYYAAGSPEPTPHQFSFQVLDEPPVFQ
jgi:hypothetical protein